jgi:hypothetical protein
MPDHARTASSADGQVSACRGKPNELILSQALGSTWDVSAVRLELAHDGLNYAACSFNIQMYNRMSSFLCNENGNKIRI